LTLEVFSKGLWEVHTHQAIRANLQNTKDLRHQTIRANLQNTKDLRHQGIRANLQNTKDLRHQAMKANHHLITKAHPHLIMNINFLQITLFQDILAEIIPEFFSRDTKTAIFVIRNTLCSI